MYQLSTVSVVNNLSTDECEDFRYNGDGDISAIGGGTLVTVIYYVHRNVLS